MLYFKGGQELRRNEIYNLVLGGIAEAMKPLIALLGVVFIWVLLEHCFMRRDYKEVGGKLYIRHGIFGKWMEIEKHLEKSHLKEDKEEQNEGI